MQLLLTLFLPCYQKLTTKTKKVAIVTSHKPSLEFVLLLLTHYKQGQTKPQFFESKLMADNIKPPNSYPPVTVLKVS